MITEVVVSNKRQWPVK